jgi:hypothetical protein
MRIILILAGTSLKCGALFVLRFKVSASPRKTSKATLKHVRCDVTVASAGSIVTRITFYEKICLYILVLI